MKVSNKSERCDEDCMEDSLYSVKPNCGFKNMLPGLLQIKKKKKKNKPLSGSQAKNISDQQRISKNKPKDENSRQMNFQYSASATCDTGQTLNGKRKFQGMNNFFGSPPNKLCKLLKSKSLNFCGDGKGKNVVKRNMSDGFYAANNVSIDVQRKQLPVHAVRNSLICQARKNQTLIFIGETACGKTTQIPQVCFECYLTSHE